jgi:hypothetical protein
MSKSSQSINENNLKIVKLAKEVKDLSGALDKTNTNLATLEAQKATKA